MNSPSSRLVHLAIGLVLFAIAAVALHFFWDFKSRPQILGEKAFPENHRFQCVSYAPFQGDESPFALEKGLAIPIERLKADMTLLSKRFACVRIYSPTGLERLPEIAEGLGMKVILGAWVSRDPVATRKEINQVITLATAHPQSVKAILVGNEALLRKEITGEQLAALIREVKQVLPNVPVSYADVWEFWISHPEVAPAVDFMTIHILPYWEDKPVSIDRAMEHVEWVRAKMARLFPDKKILIGESGWPSQGRMRQGALPSPVNQARYLRGFVRLAEEKGWDYNLIEAFDQPWKRASEGAVGGNWGIYDTLRGDKGIFTGAVQAHPQVDKLKVISFFIFGLLALLTVGVFIASKNTVGFGAWFWGVLMATLAGLVLPFQIEEIFVISRGAFEFTWGISVVFLALVSVFLFLKMSANPGGMQRLSINQMTEGFMDGILWKNTPPVYSVLHALSAVLILMAVLGFIFDSRYRSFPIYGFLVLAVVFATLARADTSSRRFYEEQMIGWLVLLGSVFILWNETIWNWQANAWIGVCALMAYSLLWPVRRRDRIQPIQPKEWKRYAIAFMAVVCVGAAACLIRYGLMESREAAVACVQTAPPAWCKGRDFMGLLIHFRFLALTGVALAAASFFTPAFGIAVAALAFSMAGLILYGIDIAGFGFVFALLRAIWLARPVSAPQTLRDTA